MYELPKTGLVRLKQILGDKESNPPIPPIIPVCPSCWWAGVKSGRFPKPIKIGNGRASFFRAEDIWALIESDEVAK